LGVSSKIGGRPPGWTDRRVLSVSGH